MARFCQRSGYGAVRRVGLGAPFALFPLALLMTACSATEQDPVATPALVTREGPPAPTAQAATGIAVGAAIETPLTGSPGLARANDDVPLPAIEDGDADLPTLASFDAAMQRADERQKVFQDQSADVSLSGDFTQGGLVFGGVPAGSRVTLNGDDVMVDDDGNFVIGFSRDSGSSALLVVRKPDGAVDRRALDIAPRDFPVDRIDGLDQSKVSGFTEAQLAKIGEDRDKKNAARAITQRQADWRAGFSWPVTGRISGVFGSQRILNGEPNRPHSGVDVAATTGTAIVAPAPGIVRLAESDMYFEGGLILLDHGQWLESAFLHLSRIDVEPGQRVEKGDVLGAVGATGRVTGPHLHWSVKWQGTLVDPQLLAGDMP